MIGTAVILSLNAYASLRETAAGKGIEKFFTLRRKGAKKASGSERRSLSPNLSGLASLRETSAEEFFTPGRKGAGGRAIGVNRPYLSAANRQSTINYQP
jgi:hypothetical protein